MGLRSWLLGGGGFRAWDVEENLQFSGREVPLGTPSTQSLWGPVASAITS